MPFITVHHPDRPDSTHKMDQFAFENVWKEKGWKEGAYVAPAKKKPTTDDTDTGSGESTTDSDT